MSGTSQPGVPFNPYKAWLGIEITGRKPTHYELLGLEFGFVDAEKAKVSVLERSAKVRHYQAGKHAELAAQVLDELAEAQLVLTDAKRKREYDLGTSKITHQQIASNISLAPEESAKINTNSKSAMKTETHLTNLSYKKASNSDTNKTNLNVNSHKKKPKKVKNPRVLAQTFRTYVSTFLLVIASLIILFAIFVFKINNFEIKSNHIDLKASFNNDTDEIQSTSKKRYHSAAAPIGTTKSLDDFATYQHYLKKGQDNIPKILNESSLSSIRKTPQQMGEKRWLAEETPTKWDAFFPFEKMKDQGNARSFLQHPFEGPMPALAVYETKGATAFSSKVRLDYDPNSPVRFAVRANGKILWQSNDLSQKGESDQCWIDIQNEKQIELLTRCKDSKTFAWAVWEEPHFINNNDYTAKIKETTRFLDIPAFHDYWKEGQDRIPKISNEPSGESSAPISQKSITIRVFPENAKVALDARFGEIDVKGPERIVTLRKASDLQGAKIMVDADGFHAQEIDLPTNGTTVTPVILETKKYYLSDMSPPKSQFAEQPWRSLKEDQRQPNSFLLHPFKAPLVAFVRYETESMTAFSSKVRLDHDPGSPVRFAVRAMDKILWQSRDLNKKGDSEEFWLDVRGLSHIELLTRTQSSASAAWAIWEEPHFIKTDIYERKAKEMAKLLEISDIKDYWSVGVHDLTTAMPPKVASVSKNPVKPELKELYSMTRFIRGNWAGSNCALTSEIASYQTFGWKKDHFVCSVCKNQTAGMVLLVRKKQPNSQICYFELVSGPKINKSVATPLGWVWKEQASATNFKDDVIKVEVLQDAGGHWRLSSDLNEIEFLTQKATWNTRFAFWAFKK